MIRVSFSTILFFGLWLAPIVHAQQEVVIRAGEHPTYSRLVIPSASNLPWELRTFGREATLTLPETSTQFQTESVFDRIPKTRLLSLDAEVVSGDTFLQLRLACDCSVSAIVEGPNLILDISDKAPDQTEKVPNFENEAASRPTPRPEDQNSTANDKADQSIPSDLTDRLIAQLNKAAEQGILELNDPLESDAVLPEEPLLGTPPDESTEQAQETGLQPIEENLDGLDGVARRLERELGSALNSDSLSSSVRIQVPEELEVPERSAPRIASKTEQNSDETPDLSHCISDELLDVAYWADERSYSTQLAQLQSRVFGEFDEPDDDAVLQLARFYIFYGLGTEAKSLLSDLTIDKPQSKLLLELANTVEGKPYLAEGVLDKAAGCAGAVALWRTAAIDATETQPVSDPEGLIQVFSELPIHVRRIVGPRLVKSFITRGQKEEANQVFAVIERAAGYHGDIHELRRAELKSLAGEDEEAELLFWRLVYEGSEVSTIAAKRLVNSLLDRNASVPPNVLATLESLAFELRGSQMSQDVLLTAIKAKAGSHNVEDAIDLSLQEIEANPEMAEEYYNAIDAIFASAEAMEIGPSEYLRIVFENLETVNGQYLSNDTKLVVAQEVMKAGLPNLALQMLDVSSFGEKPKASEVMSEASLKLRKLDAPITLNQVFENNPNLSRTAYRAYSKLGQHRNAVETALLADPDNTPQELFWRAGLWDQSQTFDKEPIALLSSFMSNRQNQNSSSNILDMSDAPNAVPFIVPKEDDITLNYVNQVKLQSTTIRTFLSEILSEM